MALREIRRQNVHTYDITDSIFFLFGFTLGPIQAHSDIPATKGINYQQHTQCSQQVKTTAPGQRDLSGHDLYLHDITRT